jgi:hypothetical protein
MSETVQFDVEKDFKRVGKFGCYQLLVFLMVGLTACIPSSIVYSYTFASATPDFR